MPYVALSVLLADVCFFLIDGYMTSLLALFIGAGSLYIGTLHGLGEVATAESALILIVIHTLLPAHVLG